MVVTDPQAQGTPSFLQRAIRMLTAPTDEWRKIEPEQTSTQQLYVGWLIPMTLIAAVAAAIGQSLLGKGVPGLFQVRLSPVQAIAQSAFWFAAFLGMTYLMGLVIDGLAPNFGAKRNPMQALKTAAYSGAAGLLFGVLQLVPSLLMLGLVGVIWSIFILHKGLPIMMGSPEEKTGGYTLAVTGIMFLCWVVCGVVIGSVRGALLGAAMFGGGFGHKSDIQVKTPGGSEVTINGVNLEEAARKMEAAAKQMEAGGAAAAVDLEKLKALLPESLPGGFQRTELSTGSTGAFGGVGGVRATYQNGDKTIRLNVGDMGAMGAIGAMAGAFGVQQSTENGDGYERTTTKGGKIVHEKLSKSGRTAEYATIVAQRFVLEADGTNAAADAVGESKLTALAAETQ